MTDIAYPLKLQMKRPTVGALQVALRSLGYSIADAEFGAMRYGATTRHAVIDFQARQQIAATGEVDALTAARLGEETDPQRCMVSGSVLDAAGLPWPGLAVEAFDRGADGSERSLARATTDAQGGYVLRYDRAQLGAKAAADLVVRAFDGTRALGASVPLFNAARRAVCDLTLARAREPAPPEFDRLAALVAPLVGGDVVLASLTPAQVAFIARKTGQPGARIEALSSAARAAGGDDRWRDFDYALAVQQLPTGPARLLQRGRTRIERALLQAHAKGLIGAPDRERIDQFVAVVLPQRRVQALLQPAAAGQPASLGDLLATLPQALPAPLQGIVAQCVGDGDDSDVPLAQLQAQGLDAIQARTVVRTLQLGRLTERNAALVGQLQGRFAAADESLAALAQISRAQWLDLARQCPPTEADGTDADRYALQTERRLDALHPAAMLAARLRSGDLVLTPPDCAELLACLDANPGLDLLHVDLRDAPATLLPGGLRQPAAALRALRRTQRLKRLGADWQETGALLNAGVTSARDVVALGPERLRETLAWQADPARADEIHARALAMHRLGLTLTMRLAPRFAPAAVAAMEATVADTPQVPADAPTLAALMGPPDASGGDPQRSVLSPAAYLADLLHFLAPLQGSGGPDPALARLLERRPDIAELALSAENTLTEMPAIDLALEVLENAVALPLVLTLPIGVSAAEALQSRPVDPAIVEALRTSAWQVGADLSVQTLEQGIGRSVWSVSDGLRRWRLEQEDSDSMKISFAGAPQALDLCRAGLDAAGLRAELQAGVLSPATLRAFDTLRAGIGARTRRLHTTACRVTPAADGSRWRLSLDLGTVVRIQGGQLQLLGDDGEPVHSRDVPVSALDAIAAGLARGRVCGSLLDDIGDDGSSLVVKVGGDGHSWGIDWPGAHDADVVPVREHLSITAIACQSAAVADTTAPQNHNPAAYDVLAAASFPWRLPFDLPLQTVRACLERLRCTRAELIARLDPGGQSSRAEAACEGLGLSAAEATLITTPLDPAHDLDALWRIWGLPPGTGPVTVRDAAAGQTLSFGSRLQALARLSVLLQQARLLPAEMQALLRSSFVNATGLLDLAPAGECDPTRMTVTDLGSLHLDLLHRFVRLWRHLDCSIEALDLALDVLPAEPGQLDGDALATLADATALAARLGLPLESTAAWFGVRAFFHAPSPLAGETAPPTLYERLFLRPVAPAAAEPAFALVDGRTLGPDAEGVTLSAMAAPIAAALAVGRLELERFIAQSGIADVLSVDNLHVLFRSFALMRALGLAVDDYLALLRLGGCAPFASPAAASALCRQLDAVTASGLSIEQLAYVLRHEVRAGSSVPLSAERCTAIVATLRATLKDRMVEWRATVDEWLRERDPQDPLLDADPASPLRVAFALGHDPGLRDALGDLVVSQLSALLGLDEAAARLLLGSPAGGAGRLSDPGDSAGDAIAVFVRAEFISPLLHLPVPGTRPGQPAGPGGVLPPPPPVPQAPETAIVVRLHKASMLLARMAVPAAQWAWQFHPRVAPNGLLGLDLDGLPTRADAAPAAFDDWRRCADLFSLRARGSAMVTLLSQVAAAFVVDAGGTGAPVAVAAALGLPLPEVQAAAARLGGAAALRDPGRFVAWFDLLAILQRLGATLAQIEQLALPWRDRTAARAAADTARDLLRANGGSDWAAMARPLFDALRARQRDALVDHLRARDALADANAIHERYLVDAQVAPALSTTRIAQAIASVQLFVQRCLLNLEEGLSLDATRRTRWEWMKNYRVWEANRKVFLFPENWLYPELRDDRTEPFRRFEAAMDGGQPDFERGSDALLGYLEDLAETSRMRVLAMYEDVALDSGRRTLHVVGRTPNAPPQYHWRWCQNFGSATMQWSGWQRIDLDIGGDHLLPFVQGGHLHLAWPSLSSVPIAKDKPGRLDAQLHWARWSGVEWKGKRVGRSALTVRASDEGEANRIVTFRLSMGAREDAAALQTVGVHAYGLGALASNPADPGPDPLPADQPFDDDEGVGPLKPRNDRAFEVEVQLAEQADDDGQYYRPQDGAYAVRFTIQVSGTYSSDAEPATPAKSGGTPKAKTGTERHQLDGATDDEGKASALVLTDQFQSVSNIAVTIVVQRAADDREMARIDRNGLDTGERYRRNIVVAAASRRAPTVWQPAMLSSGKFVFRGQARDIDVLAQDPDPPALEALPGGGTSCLANGFESAAVSFDLPVGEPASAATLPLFGRRPGTPAHVFKAAHAPEIALHETWSFQDERASFYIGVDRPSAGGAATASVFVDEIHRPEDLTLRASVAPERLVDQDFEDADDGGRAVAENYAPVGLGSLSKTSSGFMFDRAYPAAVYHWEVFLHAPMSLAAALARAQRFQDARRALHLVFDPTCDAEGEGAQRFWRFPPFRQPSASIAGLLQALAQDAAGAAAWNDTAAFAALIEDWEDQPFRPHRIARSPLRGAAYAWSTLFAYLDLLLDWADQCFRQETREASGEAVQLYVLAARLLGPRPRTLQQRRALPALSWREIAADWDEFSDAWISITDSPLAQLLLASHREPARGLGGEFTQIQATSNTLQCLYFGVPVNDKLTGYWDRVEDRLAKIRNGMNIDGQARELPLFAPPIDPGLLVRATAEGLDVAGALAEQGAPRLPYRLTTLLQRAHEACNEVKALGAALLTAIEKGEGEALAALRTHHEIEMLAYVRGVRQLQIDEAKAQIEVLEQSRALALRRFNQYQRLLGKPEATAGRDDAAPVQSSASTLRVASEGAGDFAGLGLIQKEIDEIDSRTRANHYQLAAGMIQTISSLLYAVPQITAGIGVVSNTFGGLNLGAVVGAVSSFLSIQAGQEAHGAETNRMQAYYQRRFDEWVHQSTLAVEECRQLQRQIVSARIRQAMAERELDNHDRQTERARVVYDYLRTKFSSQALYTWMQGELAGLYFQSYRLAFDLARRAERAFVQELADDETARAPYVSYGNWDGLHQGLLAGERLSLSLRRLESAHLERNRREFELTRHVSVRRLAPLALLDLVATGSCTVELPEWLFDLDAPGHYLRRIKSVALSIPAVAGPYANVNCKLRLAGSTIRRSTLLADGRYESQGTDDPRFAAIAGGIEAIVTSHGNADSGLFETSLHDERYLPFEGAGAVSRWALELPADYPSFDRSTLADVVIHLRYTARQGIDPACVSAALAARFGDPRSSGLTTMLVLRQDCADQWAAWIAGEADLVARITRDGFPYFVPASATLEVESLVLCRVVGSALVSTLVDLPPALSAGLNGVAPAGADVTLTVGDKASLAQTHDAFLVVGFSFG